MEFNPPGVGFSSEPWTIIGFALTRRIDALLAVGVGVDALTAILTKANK